MTRLVDEGFGVDVVYLDYQKAFDTVPHKRLIKKLQGYGIGGNVLAWISELLSNRTQRVSVNNSLSSWSKVTSGAPQGSVLGPVLFIIYVNELPDLVDSTMKMYADDTKLYRSVMSREDAQKMQDDLDVLSDWSKKWLLQFNVAKCKVMHCGAQNVKTKYFMTQASGQTTELEETQMEKDLGVYVTNAQPTFNCSKAANKAMSALKLLRMTFGKLDVVNFKTLYSVYIRPHLEHCIQATGPYLRQDIKALEKVQRRATKLVKGLKHLPYEERLERLNLQSVEDRIRIGDLIETFKILSGQVTIESDQFFARNHDSRTRGHHLKLSIRRAKTQARSKLFTNRVVSAWNKLPLDIVSAESTNQFKNRLDKFGTNTMKLSSLFKQVQ